MLITILLLAHHIERENFITPSLGLTSVLHLALISNHLYKIECHCLVRQTIESPVLAMYI
jgi:hypothetical protein